MLVLHPDSRCDVCLESYHGRREPLVITCGHIFCQSCLAMLPRPLCPLCRVPFEVADIRKLHADKTAVPPSTPPVAPADLDPDASEARHLQTALTDLILEGASGAETAELMSSIRSWLATQPESEHRDLAAAHRLVDRYRALQDKAKAERRRATEVEQDLHGQLEEIRQELEGERQHFEEERQHFDDERQRFDDERQHFDDERQRLESDNARLEATLQAEREHAAAKYEELEQRNFEEREVLVKIEEQLNGDKARLEKEIEEWKAKLDDASNECLRLSDELQKAKRSPHRSPRHILSSTKSGSFKDRPAAMDVTDDDAFVLSPASLSKDLNYPEKFNPLGDSDDDGVDGDTGGNRHSSATRSIPIGTRLASHRSRSNSSLLSRPDPDAMSISVPRSIRDVHMAGCSTSPHAAPIHQYGRGTEFVSASAGHVKENALGLRASPPMSSTLDSQFKAQQEQREQRERLAQLHEVLQDPHRRPSRQPSLIERQARAAIPSALSATRTPSPSGSDSPSLDKETFLQPHKHQLLATTALSSASSAAAERERARASSGGLHTGATTPNSAFAAPMLPSTLSATSLSQLTATHDREASSPAYGVYPMSGSPAQPRPMQVRRDSSASASGSYPKSTRMAPPMNVPVQPSNLARTRAYGDSSRVQ